jgi:5'-deoxynucleotidase YfbR-like HD superfamily hydrolase
MSYYRIQALRDASAVVRFHTARMTRQQTVAEHSYGVAMLVLEVEPTDFLLVRAALYHDLSEAATGDIPAPAKWDNPQLAAVLTEVEAEYDARFGTAIDLTPYQKHVLKWCDAMELVLWCREEWCMGNAYAREIMRRGMDHVMQRVRHPNDRAAAFFNAVLTGEKHGR